MSADADRPGAPGGWPSWAPPAAPVRPPRPMPPAGSAFPQLLRPTARWWRPLLGLLLVSVLLVTLSAAVILVLDGVAVLAGTPFDRARLKPDQPLGLLANNLVLAALVPAALLTVLLVHRLPPGLLASVETRLRWRLMPALLVLAFVVAGGFTVVTLPFSPISSSDAGSGRHVAGLLAIVLLTTPLQATGEEFFFRGYLGQAVASWFPSARAGTVLAALVSSLAFAAAHGSQGPALFTDRLCFGLVAAWLAWRTGGLEAGIALHVVNNLISLGIAVVTGTLTSALTPGQVGWLPVLLDLAMMLTYATAVHRWLAVRAWRTVPATPAVTSPGDPYGGPVAG